MKKRIIHQRIENNLATDLLKQQNHQSRRRGSIIRQKVTNQDREATDNNLIIDYFIENPRLDDATFRR